MQSDENGVGAQVVQIDERVDGEIADAFWLAGREGFHAKGELVVFLLRVIEIGEFGQHRALYVLSMLDGEESVQKRERDRGGASGEFVDDGDPRVGIVRGGEVAALDGDGIGGWIGCGFR